jgi:caffeoyl-CoA O-methyltransferase
METYSKTREPGMMVGALEATFLKMLVMLTNARRILEIGMFTGYTTLALAEALPKGGTIVSCEIDAERTEIAKRYFTESPHGSKIEVRLGPASETLKRVWGPFDICFIDADIEKYAAYYEACMDLVRRGGLIILDNMLHGGRVIDARDEATKQIDELNRRIRNDARVENVLLPVRDGIMLVRKL